MTDSFVVAIDGPAGAGKSTASRRLAERLGFDFLDTGAIYRCVTLAVLRAGIDSRDFDQVSRLAQKLDVRLEGDRVWIDDREVTQEIRAPEVSAAIGRIADNPAVRERLTFLQRQWVKGKRAVTEGRDQGTVVFHDSPCKIFLTASDEERARRRCEELASKGINLTFEEVLAQQQTRDAEDRNRQVGGLRRAPDAALLVTDGMSLDEVVERMSEIVASKLPPAIRETPRNRPSTPSGSSMLESQS